MDLRGSVGECLLDVRDRRQRLVLDLDELRCVLCRRAGLGHDDRDAVAGEAHPVGRERQMLDELDVVRHGPEAGQATGPCVLELAAGEGGDDTLRLARLRDVDAGDPRVRIRAADDVRPDHPGRTQVVDVATLAGEEPRVLLAQDGLSDRSHC